MTSWTQCLERMYIYQSNQSLLVLGIYPQNNSQTLLTTYQNSWEQSLSHGNINCINIIILYQNSVGGIYVASVLRIARFRKKIPFYTSIRERGFIKLPLNMCILKLVWYTPSTPTISDECWQNVRNVRIVENVPAMYPTNENVQEYFTKRVWLA